MATGSVQFRDRSSAGFSIDWLEPLGVIFAFGEFASEVGGDFVDSVVGTVDDCLHVEKAVDHRFVVGVLDRDPAFAESVGVGDALVAQRIESAG